MAYYKTPRGAYLTIKEGKVISPSSSELTQLKSGALSYEEKSYTDVFNIAKTYVTPTTEKITIPTGTTAVGKEVRIGGVLYPSQEWYDIHVAAKKVSAIDIKDSVEVPDISYDQSTPKDANKAADNVITKGTTALTTVEYWQEQWEKGQKELAEAREKEKTYLKKLTTVPEKTTEEKLEEERIKYGIPEKFKELQEQSIRVTTLKGDIDKLDIQRQTEIDRQYAQPVSMAIIQGAVNEINRTYDSKRAYKAAELGAEAALMQAYQGNLAEARSLVAETVNAYTFDLEEDRRRYEVMFKYYSDYVNDLRQDQRDVLNKAYNEALRIEKETKEEKTNVMNIMLKYPNAGIKLEDTVESATEKANKWQAEQPEEKIAYQKEWEVAGGEAGTGLTLSQWIIRRTEIEEQEKKPKLTNTQVGVMAERGLPMDVANDIHGYVLEGYDFDTIYDSMKDVFGAVQAGKYIDIYREVIRTAGMTMLVPEVPKVEVRSSYEERAKQEEQAKQEGKKLAPKEKVWWKPWTWVY